MKDQEPFTMSGNSLAQYIQYVMLTGSLSRLLLKRPKNTTLDYFGLIIMSNRLTRVAFKDTHIHLYTNIRKLSTI